MLPLYSSTTPHIICHPFHPQQLLGHTPPPRVSGSLTASSLKKSRKLLTVDNRMEPLTRMVLANSRCSSCNSGAQHNSQGVSSAGLNSRQAPDSVKQGYEAQHDSSSGCQSPGVLTEV